MTDEEARMIAWLQSMIAMQAGTLQYLSRRVDGQWAIIQLHEERIRVLERRLAAREMAPLRVQFSDS